MSNPEGTVVVVERPRSLQLVVVHKAAGVRDVEDDTTVEAEADMVAIEEDLCVLGKRVGCCDQVRSVAIKSRGSLSEHAVLDEVDGRKESASTVIEDRVATPDDLKRYERCNRDSAKPTETYCTDQNGPRYRGHHRNDGLQVAVDVVGPAPGEQGHLRPRDAEPQSPPPFDEERERDQQDEQRSQHRNSLREGVVRLERVGDANVKRRREFL